MPAEPILVRIELTFRSTSDQDPGALADRIGEAVRSIVGRESLEELRMRTLPLTRKREPRQAD